MNKGKAIMFLDVVMVAVFVLLAVASLAMTAGIVNSTVILVHHYSGLALIALIAIHVLLHLPVLISMAKNVLK
jgi:hypothetical protein